MFDVKKASELLKTDPSGRKVFNYCLDVAADPRIKSLNEVQLKEAIASMDTIFTMIAHCPNADDMLTTKDKTEILNSVTIEDRSSWDDEEIEEQIACGLMKTYPEKPAPITAQVSEFSKMYLRHGRGLTLPSMFFITEFSQDNYRRHSICFKGSVAGNLKWWRNWEYSLNAIVLNVESAVTFCIAKYNDAKESERPLYEESLKKLNEICEKKKEEADESEKPTYKACIQKLSAEISKYEEKCIEDNFQKKLFFTSRQVVRDVNDISSFSYSYSKKK